MADSVEFDASKVAGFLRTAAMNNPARAAQALYEEALVEQKESMRRTPVLTGALRASHETSRPNLGSSDGIEVTISVGGSAAPYAAKVHYDLDADHKNGQALFLESTLKESAPYFAQRIARRLGFGS